MATTRKITKKDIEAIKDFAASGYIKTASEWTTGSGRYTKRRATPVFTTEFARSQFNLNNPGTWASWGTVERTALEYFRENPRVRTILVMDRNAILDALHGAEIK